VRHIDSDIDWCMIRAQSDDCIMLVDGFIDILNRRIRCILSFFSLQDAIVIRKPNTELHSAKLKTVY